MIYDIVHRTTYVYDRVVSSSHGRLHQTPGDIDGQRASAHRITVDPAPDAHGTHVDFFGNGTATFVVHTDHEVLQVTSSCTVDTSGRPTTLPTHEHAWPVVRDRLWAPDASPADRLARGFVLESPMVPTLDDVAAYAASSFAGARPLPVVLAELVSRLHHDIAYEPGATSVDTPLATVLRDRRGVCQDLAHLLLAVLRSVGLPAAYVSGYLETEPPPGRPRLQGADRTHAWVAAYLGDGVWAGVDPTNDQVAGTRYVTTARGRDYGDVPPLKGVIYTDATSNELTVEVDVVPVS